MNIAEYAIRNKTVVLVAAGLVVVGGVISYARLGRLEDPEFTIKDALVITPYPGATAAEVEEEVTNVIEKAAQQLGQVKEVESRSENGLSTVTVTIKDKYDKRSLPQVWDELRRKINDAQGQLPPGAGPSLINDDFGDVYGIFYAITGEGYAPAEIKRYADLLRRELLLVQDVKRVELFGTREEAVFVEIPREKLAQLGIAPSTIFRALEEKNLVADAGNVEVGSRYIPIHPTGGFESVQSMENLLVSESPGRLIYLGDIAEIERGYVDPPRSLLRFDGQFAVGLGISAVPGSNVVNMGQAVQQRLAELEPERPFGMQLHAVAMQSESVEQAVGGFVVSLVEAVVIVIVVLLLFMGLRSGLIIGAVLFLTILATFVVMSFAGILLERISLGALIIALGMLVDNAIVVTEGMLIKIRQGEDRLRAARDVVGQQAMPLLGATVVAITAFGAIGLSQDSTGEYCRSLFTVLLISLLLSWLTAVTVTPLLCYVFLKAGASGTSDQDPYAGGVYRRYRQLLEFCLRRRWATAGVVLALFLLSMGGFTFVENSFFPDSTRPQFMVDVWFPRGTDIRETERRVAEIEDYVRQIELADGRKPVRSTASFVGQGGLRFLLTYAPEKLDSSYAQLLVTVDDYRTIPELVSTIQQHMDTNLIDGFVATKRFMLGPGEGGKIQVRASGPDPEVLRAKSAEIVSIMRADRDPEGRPGAQGIRVDWRQRVEAVEPELSEVQARRTGISRRDLAVALKANFEGVPVGVYREPADQPQDSLPQETRLIPIYFRGPPWERSDVASINDIQVWSPVARKMVPVRQVVSEFRTVWQDPVVIRRDRQRTITVHCDQRRGNASVLLARLMPKIEAIDLPPGYRLEWGGEYESSADAQAGLARSIPGFAVLMVFVVICLFNSLRQPTIIFLCVPLAMIGVSIGLLLTGQPFGFMPLLGALSLSGMLIKNAVVLLDEVGVQRRAGMAAYAAVVFSAVSRMRPVLMAAVTTVLGMLPLLPDAFFISMAVTIMFGLTFATVLTLIVVPVLYAIFFRVPRTSDARAPSGAAAPAESTA